MRVRNTLIASCLLCSLLLTGCAPVLNRSYSAQTPHPQYSDADMDSGYLRAESYQQLVSAILFLVSQGDSTGVIRLYNYGGSAESDLDAAYWEVIEADPLGAYAVDYIKYELSKTVSYYEVELSLNYRRSPEQIASVLSVTGTRAISGELLQLLPTYPAEAVFRVSYFEQGLREADIAATVLEAYYANPAAAVGRPEIAVQLYPAESAGRQRMVEILLDYPYEQEELLARKEALALRVEELTASVSTEGDSAARFAQVQQLLAANAAWAQDSGSDAYAALVEGRADSEGMALAASLLCQSFDLPYRLIQGTRHSEPQVWLLVTLTEGIPLHWDPSQDAAGLRSGEAMLAAGYQWE